MGVNPCWAALIFSVSTFGGGLWRSEHQLFAVVWSLPHPKQWHRISPGFLRGPIESDGFLSACTGQTVMIRPSLFSVVAMGREGTSTADPERPQAAWR